MRTITITIREQAEDECGPAERWLAVSDYPEVQFTAGDKKAAMHAVRGACLHAIADWREVPGAIQFRTVEQ